MSTKTKKRLAQADKEAIATYCNLLPEVRWDRYVPYSQGAGVYGWIDRDDGRSDFVILYIENHKIYSYMTSSARYSLEFGTRLTSHDNTKLGHEDCRRVEYLRLPVRSIHLRSRRASRREGGE